MSPKFTFKIIILGDGGVGKTTLLRRYVDNQFYVDSKMTIGVEIFQKTIILGENIECILQVWDFGGQERFRFFQDSFVLGAKGGFIAIDLTARIAALGRLNEWINLAKKYDPTIPLVLLGTKADLEDRIIVQEDFIEGIKEKNGFLKYLKTSAKTGLNVENAFEILVMEMLKRTGSEFLSTLKEKYDIFAKSLL